MNIRFITDHHKKDLGSYRIWVMDLCFYFNNNGINAKILETDLLTKDEIKKEINNIDIIIYRKGYKIKKYKNKKIGIINPDCNNINLLQIVDFIIVGSIEEKESIITHNKNCFIFPLIERMFLGKSIKKHIHKSKLIIGYYGNPHHLNHFSLGLKSALEKISQEIPIKFLYICANKNDWIDGIPNIEKEFKKWNINTIEDDIRQFDISIIPNISKVNIGNLNDNPKIGLHNSDYRIRFKNKSNNGRSLVSFQLGIPVIADITPSNMHILGNPDNGYAVLTEIGWYQAIRELSCPIKRNFVASNAYNEFYRLYNPDKWIKNLFTNIKNIN